MMSANKVAEMPINRGVGDFLKVYKIWETGKTLQNGRHTILLSTKGNNESEVPKELVELLNYIGAEDAIHSDDCNDSYVRQLQNSVNDIKKSRQMEERFMMIEELMQEEFQAGKEEGKQEGMQKGKAEALRAAILDIFNIRHITSDAITHLLDNTSDTKILTEMHHTAISCSNAEEFLDRFHNQNTDQ